jgi:predicted RNA-binding Zn-ribbon protein involved in translation (DUF1610 family)
MALSEKELWARTCGAKQRHVNERAAVSVACKMMIQFGGRFAAYKCRFCGWWHIGHDEKKRAA